MLLQFLFFVEILMLTTLISFGQRMIPALAPYLLLVDLRKI